jgi:hypothetical protein
LFSLIWFKTKLQLITEQEAIVDSFLENKLNFFCCFEQIYSYGHTKNAWNNNTLIKYKNNSIAESDSENESEARTARPRRWLWCWRQRFLPRQNLWRLRSGSGPVQEHDQQSQTVS